MAYPQLTSVLQLARDLQRAVGELGALPAARALFADLGVLIAYASETGVDVDVLVTSPLSTPAANSVTAWLSASVEPAILENAGSHSAGEVYMTLADGRSSGRILDMSRAPVQKVATPRPSVLVTVGSPISTLEPEQQEVIVEIMEDRALVVMINEVPDEPSPVLESLAQRQNAVVVESVNGASLPPNGWRARLGTGATPALPGILRAYATIYGLETASKSVRIVLDQEQRSVKVKRALAQQESAKLQQPGANPMELVTETRTRMQRTFSDFDRSVQEGLRSLFLPQVGTLSKSVDSMIAKLPAFEEQRGEKTITLRISERFTAEFLNLIRSTCRQHCLVDLKRLEVLFNTAVAEGNASLAAADAPAISVQHVSIAEGRLTRMLDSVLRIDRPYRGELPNPGAQEYIQQSKKYLNIFLAVAPLLGVSSLTKVIPNTYILGITILLIFAGAATLPQRIKRERAENLEKEFERAREAMRTEARRIFSEVEREWMAMISEALRDEQTFFTQQFESAVREGQTRRTSDLADDKRRLQRQLSGMDTMEKLLAAAKRTRETVESSLAQLRNALRPQLVAATAGDRRPA